MRIIIHQIYFDPRQRPQLDASFIPYDNSNCPRPDEREYYVFNKEYSAGHIQSGEWTGFVSWKFGAKTNLSGRQFIHFCQSNPGFDVYFINPFPHEMCMGNVWQQGSLIHPHLLEISQYIFDQLGMSVRLDSVPNTSRINAYCNFWVGNKWFWDKYMEFCGPIYQFIQNDLKEPYRSQLFSLADRQRHASHFSFLFERLFSTFLHLHPEIKSLGYTYSRDELNNKYVRATASLIQAIQEIEKRAPDRSEPIRSNPSLKVAMSAYKVLSPTARRIWNRF